MLTHRMSTAMPSQLSQTRTLEKKPENLDLKAGELEKDADPLFRQTAGMEPATLCDLFSFSWTAVYIVLIFFVEKRYLLFFFPWRAVYIVLFFIGGEGGLLPPRVRSEWALVHTAHSSLSSHILCICHIYGWVYVSIYIIHMYVYKNIYLHMYTYIHIYTYITLIHSPTHLKNPPTQLRLTRGVCGVCSWITWR